MRNNVNVPVVHPVSADVMWKMNDRVFNVINFTVFMQHCQKISHTPEGKKTKHTWIDWNLPFGGCEVVYVFF